MLFDEDVKIPTRAEIYEHAQGSIHKLDSWLKTLHLPVGAIESIYSDLESYNYTEDEQ